MEQRAWLQAWERAWLLILERAGSEPERVSPSKDEQRVVRAELVAPARPGLALSVEMVQQALLRVVPASARARLLSSRVRRPSPEQPHVQRLEPVGDD